MWPCCRSIGSRQPNLSDEDGKPRHIYDKGGVAAGMDTAAMRMLRRNMLEGHRPPACERCYMVEDLGMRSHRQTQNELWNADIPHLLADTEKDGSVNVTLRTADIRLGNTCNLRCRMCSPQSSQALIPEWAAHYGLPREHRHFDAYRHFDWFDRPEFWTMLENQAPKLVRINFAGGEPLLIRSMFDFLERMVASGQAGNMTISYNTNLTILPKRVFALWPSFKSIRVTVSIDGFGAVNDFIRFPSRWDDIDANLRTLDRESDQLNLGAGLSTNTAVQVYNVFRLGELLDYMATELTCFEVPNLSIVTYPEYLDLRILPAELKELAEMRLRAAISRSADLWRERWGDDVDRLVAAIEGVISHMRGDDRSELLPQFLRWASHQDHFRGQSTSAAVPELAPLFANTTTDGASPDNG